MDNISERTYCGTSESGFNSSRHTTEEERYRTFLPPAKQALEQRKTTLAAIELEPRSSIQLGRANRFPNLPHQSAITLATKAMPSPEEIERAHKVLYEAGLQIRKEVAGASYVDRALANGSSDFARPMQELVTEACWGSVWSRPGLERKQRSLLNIAMLCALNRSPELGVHVRGAVNNGASEVEIRETILQASMYCGMPAGMEGFKVAERVIEEMKKEKGQQGS